MVKIIFAFTRKLSESLKNENQFRKGESDMNGMSGFLFDFWAGLCGL